MKLSTAVLAAEMASIKEAKPGWLEWLSVRTLWDIYATPEYGY